MTDVQTQRTETRALPNRSQHAAAGRIAEIEGSLPFPILGFDTDHGGEFLNWHLVDYFKLFKTRWAFMAGSFGNGVTMEFGGAIRMDASISPMGAISERSRMTATVFTTDSSRPTGSRVGTDRLQRIKTANRQESRTVGDLQAGARTPAGHAFG